MSISTQDEAGAAVSYSMFRSEGNRAVYIGPAHSDLSKDQIILQSVSPKQSGGTYGNRRSSLNYNVTVTTANPDGTSSAKDAKVEIVVSLPAGISDAAVKEAFARVGTIALNDTLVLTMFKQGQIEV